MAAVPEQFESAAGVYYRLIQLCPDNDDYKFDLAMCLYKACKYDEAMKASFSVQSSKFAGRVQQLQAAIKYMEDDLPAAKSLIEKQGEDSCEAVVNQGCILYKEGYHSEAIAKFQQAIQLEGVKAHLSYNIALCYFNMKQYSHALKNIAEIIERGIKDHPELSVGLATEGIDVRSVGNTAILHETSLVEAFNLKAAVEYNMGPANIDTAAEALTDMPPRAEEELDPVTLHNSGKFFCHLPITKI
jgi:tetratricopeptide repeat protein 30